MVIQSEFSPQAIYEECTCQAVDLENGSSRDALIVLPTEHRLTLEIDQSIRHTFVCSPCQLPELCIGWMLSSGTILQGAEVHTLTICADGHHAKAGILRQQMPGSKPEEGGVRLDRETVRTCLDLINHRTDAHLKTHATHSSAVFSADGAFVLCEDVSRTNAVDKAIGAAVLQSIPIRRSILVCSGRISGEIAGKALQCGIPAIVSNAAASVQAIRLARENRIRLAFFAREAGFYV